MCKHFCIFSRDSTETDVWQEYADRIFPKLQTEVQSGALIWNWDCQFASWSMKGLHDVIGVQWNL